MLSRDELEVLLYQCLCEFQTEDGWFPFYERAWAALGLPERMDELKARAYPRLAVAAFPRHTPDCKINTTIEGSCDCTADVTTGTPGE